MSEEFGPKYAYFLPSDPDKPVVVKQAGAMTPERWKHIKSLEVRPTQMFVSCAPDKDKHSRATYRKAEHGARD